jgi:hypothetical protein
MRGTPQMGLFQQPVNQHFLKDVDEGDEIWF